MNFLNWLYLRLKNKYNEDPEILYQLNDIIKNYKLINTNIDIEFIDNICKNHFVEFDMEKTPDLTFGFTEEDRNKYRGFVLDILKNIIK